jgi:hypothetical protein
MSGSGPTAQATTGTPQAIASSAGRFVRRGTRDHIGGPQQLRDFGDGGVRVHA